MFWRLFTVVVCIGLLASACAPLSPVATPTAVRQAPIAVPVPTVPPAPVSNVDYGIHMFIADHPATTERDLRMATDAGFRWQKSLFKWREIEGTGKGVFDWRDADRVVRATRAAGLRILARLDFEPMWSRKDQANNGPPDNFQDYAEFVSAFVSRYRADSPIGRVDAIEIWNEPNLDREWGNQTISSSSAADYVRLLGGAYQAAHAANPTIIVVSAGLSPNGVTDGHSADDLQYLQWMYDAGLQAKFDVLGAHANTQAPGVATPLGALKDFSHPSFYFRRVEQLRQLMVARGDGARQIWLTEWGWTSDTVHKAFSWFAVSENKKADNLIQAFQYARENWSPWIGLMSVWTLPDPAWTLDNEEYWWAIANPDGTPRPAYLRIREDRQNGTLP